MAEVKYFDVKRDNELIAAGTHFWCESCLTARSVNEGSPDLRYCQSCYDFLMVEAEIKGLTGIIKPSWVPRKTPIKSRARKNKSVNADIKRLLKKANGNGKREKGVVTPSRNSGQAISSGVEEPVPKLKPSKDTHKNIVKAKTGNFVTPGRPKKILPEKEIIKLNKKGASVRDLARQYNVSHMTIQRILNGQRVLV